MRCWRWASAAFTPLRTPTAHSLRSQDIVLPSSVEVLGQQVDLKPLQGVLQPLEGPLRGALSQLGDLLSRQADLQFPIRSPRASTWLLNTYLDEVTAAAAVGRGQRGWGKAELSWRPVSPARQCVL